MIVFRVIWLAVGYIAGICLAAAGWAVRPTFVLPVAAALAAAAGVVQWLRERRWVDSVPGWVAAAMLAVGLPAGYLRSVGHMGPPEPGSLRAAFAPLADRQRVGVRGTVYAEPEIRENGRGDLPLRVDQVRVGPDGAWRSVQPGNVLLVLRVSRRSFEPDAENLNLLMDPRAYGWRVEAEASYRAPRPGLNPGGFSETAFLLQNDQVAQMTCGAGRVRVLERSSGGPLTELALEAKRSFLSTYKAVIRAPASRLYAGATLGARRAVEKTAFWGKDITQTFRHAGVGHVLAVSGLHVSVVSILLYGLFRAARLQPRQFTPLVIAFLVMFAILTGARPSSVRSVIMNAAVLIAFSYFRCNIRRATYTGLSLSSTVILLGNPVVLFSPGFLLSFGAVLSLVLVAPPLHRVLGRLRGGTALLLVVFCAAVFALACLQPAALINRWNLVGLAGALGLVGVAGRRLDHLAPPLRRLDVARLPLAVRMMLAAQLAIQIGMMVPLSAWFFGQFPVAGMLVNLVAIPAIGVVIQLGLLIGLIALIPWIGMPLAIPLGAAATLAGDFFYATAWSGTLLPYPAVPRPSLAWMAGYYGLLGLVLLADEHRHALRALWYAAWRRSERRPLWRTAWALAPCLLLAAPLLNLVPQPERIASVTCIAAGNYPSVGVRSTHGHTTLINAGASFDGSSGVFAALREAGAMRVETAVLPAFPPDSGWLGLPALAARMPVARCLVPVAAASPEGFLDAIGDAYLSDAVRDRAPWATRHVDGFRAWLDGVDSGGIGTVAVLRPGEIERWYDGTLRALPTPERPPKRFASSARGSILTLDMKGWRWLIVTDTTPDALEEGLRAAPGPYNVAVLPALPARSSYERILTAALQGARPRAVILCAAKAPNPGRELPPDAPAPDVVFVTARDGAVTARVAGDSLVLRSFASRREAVLPAR